MCRYSIDRTRLKARTEAQMIQSALETVRPGIAPPAGNISTLATAAYFTRFSSIALDLGRPEILHSHFRRSVPRAPMPPSGEGRKVHGKK